MSMHIEIHLVTAKPTAAAQPDCIVMHECHNLQ